METRKGPDAGGPRGAPPEPAGDLEVRTAGIGQPLNSSFEGSLTPAFWPQGEVRRIGFWSRDRSLLDRVGVH